MMIAEHADPSGKDFFEQLATYLPLEDRYDVHRAFEMAKREHGDEKRKSGELFFTHPLTVASYLAEYYVDSSALIAALLHDVAEDTSVSVDEISNQFGVEVGRIVDGLTKFDRVTAKAKLGRELSAEEVKTATIYKLFNMMTTDMRVGIVKIFDRLHNMRTIRATPPHKQQIKARETLSIYAPLANRLGMWKVKNELQRISLEILDERRYTDLSRQIEERDSRHQQTCDSFTSDVTKILSSAGLNVAQVLLAEQDIYKYYQLWINEPNGEARIRDEALSVVVLLRDTAECYTALYHIHNAWRPIPGELKDYIGAPRTNLYRSLHTGVTYHGQPIKIQLRTLSMQIESQSGVLSRWQSNQQMQVWSSELADRVDAMINTISTTIQTEFNEMNESVKQVLDDVFIKQIIVYTPDGDQRELPHLATPIDFAYTIHTAVGNSCRGAVVNGVKRPLTYHLKDGDSVKIERHGTDPQRTWLDDNLGYLHTTNARSAVRRWFRKQPEERATAQGKRLLRTELDMLNQLNYPHSRIAHEFGYETENELYFALGRAEILPTDVAIKILSETWTEEPTEPNEGSVRTNSGEQHVIKGAGNRELHLCGTCKPQLGDPILGFIRRDGVVTVHSSSCHTLDVDAMQQGRSLKLRWKIEEVALSRPVTIHINVHDRNDLLHDITHMMHEEQVNITAVCASTKQHAASIMLTVAVNSPRQIVRLLHRIHALVNVIKVIYLGPVNIESSDFNPDTCPFMVLNEGFCDVPLYLNGNHKKKPFVAK